ncbi:MAG TPA: methyltransferase domain-containing protein, partial [Actinopolymorphaceae bacterium]
MAHTNPPRTESAHASNTHPKSPDPTSPLPGRSGSWLVDRPLRGPALPHGRWARLWGWVLLLNRAEQREVLDAAGIRTGDHVLEVGCGPGVLLRLAAAAGARVTGVDPSPEMVRMARRRAPSADVRVGTAEETGLPDAAVDLVLSVNNVPMWSDLDDGFAELFRVLRPGGRLVVAWHGGTRPSRAARRLTLPPDVLERIRRA